MERMVNRRLVHFLESNGHLDHRQHAFRSGHGTGTYFATLGQVLHDAKAQEQHVELATLDLAKAYNRAWTPGVINQLSKWGLTGHVLHFLRNFLRNRTFQVCIGNHRSNTFSEETGIPQGSVIAVTIFLIAMNGVFSSLPKEIFIFVYADDIMLVVIGSTEKALRRKLQASVNAVAKWGNEVGFELSAEKSAIMHLCTSRHRPIRSLVTANGQPIPLKKSVRVLGIHLDRHLTFVEHFKEVKRNCQTRLNLLRTLSRRHNTSNRDVRLRVAAAIIDSRLLYGIELSCTTTDAMVTSLAPVYHQSIRIASGLLPSTPSDAVCAETGRLPFTYLITETVCKRAISFLEKTTPCTGGVLLLDEANRLLRGHVNQVLPPVGELGLAPYEH